MRAASIMFLSSLIARLHKLINNLALRSIFISIGNKYTVLRDWGSRPIEFNGLGFVQGLGVTVQKGVEMFLTTPIGCVFKLYNIAISVDIIAHLY